MPRSKSVADTQVIVAWSLVGLLVLAGMLALHEARVIVLPIVIAGLLSLVLHPIVKRLRHWGVPDGIGALLVLLLISGALAYGVYSLSGPVQRWLDEAPRALRTIEHRVRSVRDTVREVTEATDRVEDLADIDGKRKRGAPVVRESTLSETLLTRTWQVASTVAAGGFVIFVLAYFLLASGDLFLRKLVRTLPRFHERRRAVLMTREIQDSVSSYLSTVTAINLGLGAVIAAAMAAIGMPNPLLWGTMATLLNFVPYFGSALGVCIVFLAGVLSFPTLQAALVAPASYLVLTVVEGYFVTPIILSRRFTLNPAALIMGVLLWGWLWGVPGALLAVPILMTFKIVCDHVDSLRPVGDFLGT